MDSNTQGNPESPNTPAPSPPPAALRTWPHRVASHAATGAAAGALLGALDGWLAARAHGMATLQPAEQGATLTLLTSIDLLAGVATGLGLGCATAAFAALVPAPRRAALWRFATRPATLITGAVLLAVAFGIYEYFKRLDWDAIPWATLSILALTALTYLGLAWRLRTTRWTSVAILGAAELAFLIGLLSGWSGLGEAQREGLLRVGVESATGVFVLPLARSTFDGDGDGFPTRLCVDDCDCDDTRDAIFPGAPETADNGVDEDCNGRDLSSAHLADLRKTLGVRETAPPEPATPREPTPQPEAPDPFLALDRDGPPNILFIVVDTLRADYLGCYGHELPTTPNIDKLLCKRSVVFDQARATGSQTRFSVPPIITGKYFSEIKRSSGKWPKVHKDEYVMAERLKDAGYYTVAVHSIGYFQRNFKFYQGFDLYDTHVIEERWPLHHNFTSDLVTDRVLEHLDNPERPQDKPFFMWAYYGDPHAIFLIHKAYVKTFGKGRKGLYRGEIAFTDEHIGRLMTGLEERGILEDTLIVFTSDHGEGLNKKEDHGHVYHGPNLYDEVIRVPLMVMGPGIEPARVPTSVSLLDLLPTFLEVAEMEPDPEMRGISLIPWLRGKRPKHPPVFFEKHKPDAPKQKGMVHWPYKVHWIPDYNRFMIYNLENDPRETEDLYKTLPEAKREELVELIQYWKNDVLKPRKAKKF